MALIVSCVIFSFGVALQTASTSVPLMLAGRFFAGFGVGLVSALSKPCVLWDWHEKLVSNQCSSTLPVRNSAKMDSWCHRRYIPAGNYHWIAPCRRRRQCDSKAQRYWLLQVGTQLLPYAATLSNSCSRIPIAVQFAYALILMAGMVILPETPRYLVKKGRHDKALSALAQLRRLPIDHPSIVHELDEIEANHEFELSLGKATYLDCLKGNVGKRLLTGCLLQILQQLTGVNFIFYYGTNL